MDEGDVSATTGIAGEVLRITGLRAAEVGDVVVGVLGSVVETLERQIAATGQIKPGALAALVNRAVGAAEAVDDGRAANDPRAAIGRDAGRVGRVASDNARIAIRAGVDEQEVIAGLQDDAGWDGRAQ